jgi:hypothetical protein
MELRSTRTRLQTGRVIDHCHAPVLARRRRRRALLIRHSRSLLSRRGSSVARDNKLANSVQTHVFDSGSTAGHLSAGKSGLAQHSSPGSSRGRKVENFEQRLRVESARGEEALTVSHVG